MYINEILFVDKFCCKYNLKSYFEPLCNCFINLHLQISKQSHTFMAAL